MAQDSDLVPAGRAFLVQEVAAVRQRTRVTEQCLEAGCDENRLDMLRTVAGG